MCRVCILYLLVLSFSLITPVVFRAQCKDRQEQQQQQHLQDKRVNEKDGQMIKLEEGGKRRDSEVGTFDGAEAHFLF